MEGSVRSEISGKTYMVELKKLHKDDINAQSELFEIDIFGTIIHIAPGKSIIDEDRLVYFYVYVIKQQKVVAKLGVYEKMTKEVKEIYNLSEFPDGSLLMFDVKQN